jgi:hypothetical protein
MNFGLARVVAFLAIGLFSGRAEAGQEGTDLRLEDMGFIMRGADTPEQIEHLRILPPRKFVARIKTRRRSLLSLHGSRLWLMRFRRQRRRDEELSGAECAIFFAPLGKRRGWPRYGGLADPLHWKKRLSSSNTI